MKIKILITLMAVLLAKTSHGQNTFIEMQKSVMISKEKLKYGYNPIQDMSKSNEKQPFSTKEESENFLFHMTNENINELPPAISSWISQNITSYSNDAAIIFVRHPLKLEKLFNTSYKSIEETYTEVCEKNKEVNNTIDLYNIEYVENLKKYEENVDSIKALKVQIEEVIPKNKKKKNENIIKKLQSENNQLISRLTQLRPLIESHKKDSELYLVRLKELQNKYNEARNFIVEDTSKFITTILAKENFEWSDYLLNKKNIMLVFLGGASSFKNYQLQITNNKKKYQEDFEDLLLLMKSIGINFTPEFRDATDDDCSPKSPDESQIPLTYVLIKRSKIIPPSTIEFITDKKDKKLLTTVHEKSFIGIKVGVSIQNIDKKNFSLNQNNQLTVETDSLNPKDLKLNMMAFLELYPFGRDYDRLKPFWEKDNIPLYERVGIVGGLKISKNPLESLFLGASFAISKPLNVTIGMAFNKISKDVDSLLVGQNTTLEYLQRNAGKEYKPTLFIGISLSPGQLFKVFGVKK